MISITIYPIIIENIVNTNNIYSNVSIDQFQFILIHYTIVIFPQINKIIFASKLNLLSANICEFYPNK